MYDTHVPVGATISAVLVSAIAFATDPVIGAACLVFYIIYQQVENYLLAPPITAHTMDIHPAVAFGAVIAGASILGPVGALLALPAGAQQPGKEKPPGGLAPLVTHVDVSVTNLDVIVTDSKGNRVTGLRKEDFEVVEDGLLPVGGDFCVSTYLVVVLGDCLSEHRQRRS